MCCRLYNQLLCRGGVTNIVDMYNVLTKISYSHSFSFRSRLTADSPRISKFAVITSHLLGEWLWATEVAKVSARELSGNETEGVDGRSDDTVQV